MANTIEYIFSLQDKMSAKIGNITVNSDRMLGKFADLEKKTLSVNRTFNETGRTLGSLREKIAFLQAEREWIPAENIEGIRAYNREMKKLNKEINKLESLNGGKFKKWSKEAFAAMPGANLISNPLVAGGAALGFAGKSAMNFDEGMAKVNITAQLDEKGLSDLSNRLKKLAKDNHTEIEVAPAGLEKIISQVGDADLSMQILDASLKGSKAGFTDLDTVSGALAQSLSVIGKENTNAKEVLDTFFAAKRVGAGEFADFARYMPGLIAGASNMGINFKEVAGTFAYMTGKGQSAERAAVLMENAFSMLGKSDVRGKMEKAGIKVFDEQGKMRGMVDIFTDLKGVLDGMTDEQKSSILEKFGLVDKEAKNAFALMTSDLGKFKEAMDATANSTGETDKALLFSQNSIQKVTQLWNDFKNMGTAVGTIILPVINVGLDVLSLAINGLSFLLDSLIGLFSWWSEQLQTGNPIIWGITAAITALSAALLINYARSNAVFLLTKAKVIWDGIQAVATWGLTAAQWALNTAFLACPLTWIVFAIGAVVGIVVACWNKFEGFRQFIFSMWETIKVFGSILMDSIVEPFKQIIKGLGAVGSALVHLVKGNFKEAATAAKEGFKDIAAGSLKASPVGMVIGAGQKTMAAYQDGTLTKAWDKGQQRGHKSWQASQAEKNKYDPANIQVAPAPTGAATSTGDYEKLEKLLNDHKKKIGKGGAKGSKVSKVLDLNDAPSTPGKYRQTSDYAAAIHKLAPVKVDFAPVKEKLQAKVQDTPEKVNAVSDKVTDARQRFANAASGSTGKVNESNQEYAPEKTDFLKDIMMNVRKIAAVGAIPLAISLASPMPAEAGILEKNVRETPAVTVQNRIPEIHFPLLSSVPGNDKPEVSFASPWQSGQDLPAFQAPDIRIPEIPVPDIVATPQLPVGNTQAGQTEAPFASPWQSGLELLAFQTPDIKVPEMPVPATPDVNVQVRLPEMPTVPAPSPEIYNYESNERITEHTERFDKETVRESGRSVQMDHFCDQIVIHIQNTDGKGQETIRQEVIKVLNEVLEG